jgi:ATP-binding cassette subfamily F protein 2
MLILLERPHVILLDEPTNHLVTVVSFHQDMDSIDSLATAINNFPGGLVLVSHDFRLINQVAKEIWEVKDKKVTVFKGDILDYKKTLRHH